MDVEYCNKPIQPDQVEIQETPPSWYCGMYSRKLYYNLALHHEQICWQLLQRKHIISFICIWLSMHQNSRQWIFLNNFIVTCFGVWQQALILKLLYSFTNDIFILNRQVFIRHHKNVLVVNCHDDCGPTERAKKCVDIKMWRCDQHTASQMIWVERD